VVNVSVSGSVGRRFKLSSGATFLMRNYLV